ncbi:DUF58 domain-containing protein [Ruficoccus amylovorans]|uniref:DUF58 domain-containing protein n=1 Tax=Ruficoccus amylovorans TaxID=1804625 RepID=A0A842HJ05_9BACT|nr:DUF58 domain-containing protein [Ruficoccus amylovorans]MBC2595566.1 DUF58 domain-containing protein [Ruficoccus amylovorans]
MPPSVHDLLDPAHLAQLGNYALLSRTAVEGFLSGMHRSLFHGFGTEFLQYRDYTPGADLKYLDWKLLARTDRLYTKVYQEETNMNLQLVLDTSASMDYRGERAACTKLHYACMTAACLAYMAVRQGDNVGLFAYGDTLQEVVPPGHRTGQLDRVLQALTRLRPAGPADHDAMLQTFGNQLRQRSIVIYISDMLEAENLLPEHLKRFRLRHCDTLAVQVLDSDELDLPIEGVARFHDIESGREIISWAETTRDGYKSQMSDFMNKLRDGFTRSQVDLLRLTTDESLGYALARYLHHREALR